MTTIADFRPSISQMSSDTILNLIRSIRAQRRMLLERPVRISKAKKTKKATKNSIKSYLETLGKNESKVLLEALIKIKETS